MSPTHFSIYSHNIYMIPSIITYIPIFWKCKNQSHRASLIKNYIKNHDIDFIALQESWGPGLDVIAPEDYHFSDTNFYELLKYWRILHSIIGYFYSLGGLCNLHKKTWSVNNVWRERFSVSVPLSKQGLICIEYIHQTYNSSVFIVNCHFDVLGGAKHRLICISELFSFLDRINNCIHLQNVIICGDFNISLGSRAYASLISLNGNGLLSDVFTSFLPNSNKHHKFTSPNLLEALKDSLSPSLMESTSSNTVPDGYIHTLHPSNTKARELYPSMAGNSYFPWNIVPCRVDHIFLLKELQKKVIESSLRINRADVVVQNYGEEFGDHWAFMDGIKLEIGSSEIYSLCYDENVIVAGGFDPEIHIIRIYSGDQFDFVKFPHKLKGVVTRVCVHKRKIYAATSDSMFGIYDLDTGHIIKKFRDLHNLLTINDITTISSDLGEGVATCGDDGKVKVITVSETNRTNVLNVHSNKYQILSVSSSNRSVLFGGLDGKLNKKAVFVDDDIEVLKEFESPITQIVAKSDVVSSICVLCMDGCVHLFSNNLLISSCPSPIGEIKFSPYIIPLAFSDNLAFVGDSQGSVHVVDVYLKEKIAEMSEILEGRVNTICTTPFGIFASGVSGNVIWARLGTNNAMITN